MYSCSIKLGEVNVHEFLTVALFVLRRPNFVQIFVLLQVILAVVIVRYSNVLTLKSHSHSECIRSYYGHEFDTLGGRYDARPDTLGMVPFSKNFPIQRKVIHSSTPIISQNYSLSFSGNR